MDTPITRLLDGLSDMIEGGRLTETDIPDDYRWLVDALIAANAHVNALATAPAQETPTKRELALLADMRAIGEAAQAAFAEDSGDAECDALSDALRIAHSHCPDLPEDDENWAR